MLSRTQLRQFLALVDTGSFTRAANSLGVTQPSLSGGIGEMERHLGTRLFVRERRRIRLTEAGNALLPLARSIEAGFHQAESRIGGLSAPLRPIRIGVLETAPLQLIECAVANYAGQDPLDMIEGSSRELGTALANGSIDLALTLLPDPVRDENVALLEEDYCLAVAAHHPLAGIDPIRVEQVVGEAMIVRRSCEILTETSRFFTERGARPRFALRSANDHRVMAMVRAGMGVTVAPRSLGDKGIGMATIIDFGLRRRIGLTFGQHWDSQFGAKHPIIDACRRAAVDLYPLG